MTDLQRIKDIVNTGHFNNEEIEKHDDRYIYKTFKSWEYYMIFHFSDFELFHMDEETKENLNEYVDLKLNTNKGQIYCFK